MTCVVGYIDKDNERLIMGSDSAGSDGSHVQERKDPKIFEKGDFLIGCTTSFRMIQIMKYSMNLPEIGNKDIFEYMCTDFVNTLIDTFKCKGFHKKYDDGSLMGGTFLVGYKNRLFAIYDDFQVCEVKDDFNAVGSGYKFALGALKVLSANKDLSVEEKVLIALDVSERYSAGVRRPFHIYKKENTNE